MLSSLAKAYGFTSVRAKLCWDADSEGREEDNGEGRGGYSFKGDALSAAVTCRLKRSESC